MLLYLLKSGACLALFYLFYRLLLERENIHVFKRYYLLGSVLLSFVIPLLVFTEAVAVTAQPSTTMTTTEVANAINVPQALEADVMDISPLLWIAYFLGVLFFGLRFLRNLFRILRRIRKNPRQKSGVFTHILLPEKYPPHTFFKYIFVNKNDFESEKIPNEVLLHEETHVRQRHSIDVLFMELLQVMLWFNPFIYFVKRAIKLNHEFLADKEVLKKGIERDVYQNTLLSFSSKSNQPFMANAINYSSIKKRFTVMKTNTSKRASWLKCSLVLPLVAFLMFSFSSTKLIPVPANDIDQIPELHIQNNLSLIWQGKPVALAQLASTIQESIPGEIKSTFTVTAPENLDIPTELIKGLQLELAKIGVTTIDLNGLEVYVKRNVPIQDGASRAQMAEYNKLARHYNHMDHKNMRIKLKDVERLEYLYSLMSDKQKADAEPFPDFPKPPPPPPSPEVAVALKTQVSPKVAPAEKVSVKPALASKEKMASVSPLVAEVPPAPPIPPDPLDHIIELAREGARFQYEGNPISSDKAIEIVKSNKSINIQVIGINEEQPLVKLSKSPITFED